MIKKYSIAIKRRDNVIEAVLPKRNHDTIEEAEEDIEQLFGAKDNYRTTFVILPSYTKSEDLK